MLDGIRVLSFTHFLQGPSASQMLADMGADVIKVEPLGGAFERAWSGPDAFVDDVSVFYALANRNIRSIAIDLKATAARDVLRALVKSADVLIESFRPGTMSRLGLGYAEVSAINPRLVYCSLTGYGSDGPYVDRPGQDVLLQALSGLAMATGRAGDPPTPVGASAVDQHGAALAVVGILGALLGRARHGRGTLVESNLLNAALDLQIEPLGYFLNGWRAERSPTGISSPYYKAPYGVFATADGYLCLSINPLDRLARVFQDEWFGDVVSEPESHARREQVNARVARHMRGRTSAQWMAQFEQHGVWFAPVNGYEEVVTDPQVLHNESFLNVVPENGQPMRVLAHPIRYGGVRPGVVRQPPRLGSATVEVLHDLGFEDEQVTELLRQGVVRDAGRQRLDSVAQ
jgi:crotonobetainyl-CoA:carnitine CoA-transferase CaiB-like acyl-CoA transferase